MDARNVTVTLEGLSVEIENLKVISNDHKHSCKEVMCWRASGAFRTDSNISFCENSLQL